MEHYVKVFGGFSGTSLGAALGGIYFNPFFISSITAIVTGFSALKMYFFPVDEEDRSLSRKHKKYLWGAGFGFGIALVQILVGTVRLVKVFVTGE
jgi:hypothetical protein